MNVGSGVLCVFDFEFTLATPVPTLPLLGQLLLALGLTAAGVRLMRRRQRVPPGV